MSYSKFKKLDVVREKLGLTIKPENSYFSKIEPQQISDFLKKTLDRNFKLAVSIQTEKARSELIVAPILVELKIISNPHISLFSGTELNVDSKKWLNGVCDFIISDSELQIELEAPIVALVEAKKNDLKFALPQCIAEMYASQIFNERKNNNIKRVFGIVTTGSLWNFLYLENDTVFVDEYDYSLENVNRIFGILLSMVEYNRSN